MSIKERPLTIRGITFNNYEEFREYVLSNRISKEDSIRHLEEKMSFLEQKYKMSTQEFAQKIVSELLPMIHLISFVGQEITKATAN